MPQIFTGKVVIPGEQLPQYLEAMAETEEPELVREELGLEQADRELV